MMQSIKGRRIVILGSTGGIGLMMAKLVADRGAVVTVGGLEEGELRKTAALVPRAKTIQVDATQVDSLRRFFAEAGATDDLIVTVARHGGSGPAQKLVEQDLLGAFAGKPIAHLQAISLALPTLAENGSITLITGASALSALPRTAALAAVNGAIEAAVPPLARELAPRRVNAVSPGVIESGWWDIQLDEEHRAAYKGFAERTPVGRNGRVEDVAHAIVALIENDYINGVVLPCDGGLRLT